ncbi:MAG TPA: type II secretion system F family protein [Stellaceae bacterium]|nr:type II secretion system F family protein [Stellaceae bacterium]
MPVFRYEAVNATGEVLSGEMEAADQASVVARLQAQGHVPIRADEAGYPWLSRLLARPLFRARPRLGGDLALITQQLGTLLHAGFSIDHVLETAKGMVDKGAARDCLDALLDSVRGGGSLADAMAAQGDAFPAFYVSMVRAGEAGASLDVTLQHLADLLERSQAAREQAKSALIYPAIVLATGVMSIAVLFGFVIPRFVPLFEQAGTTLPLMTRIVLAASTGFRDYWWTLLVVAAAAVLAWRRIARNPEYRLRYDRRLLTLPLLGDLTVKTEMARFGRVLGMLLRSGVALLPALAIGRDTLTNTALRDAVGAVSEQAKEGKGLAGPLAQTGVMPALVVQMVRVGEESARLDEMLLRLADIYDRESRRSVDRLLALLVPAVTIGLGLVVAVVVSAILSAIFSVYNLAM